MIVEPTEIKDVVTLVPQRFGDDRGYFCETFNQKTLLEAMGLDVEFVQDNESLSVNVGTVRGLHFQLEPHSQGKLVRVIAGKLLDVCVDIRRSSETFGKHIKVELDASIGKQLWVPPGFAHGFCTLEPNTVISYKVTDFYNAEADRSLKWNDSELGIDWPDCVDPNSLSSKDINALDLSSLEKKEELFD